MGIPAAVVNSGLKYMQKKIELAFQVGRRGEEIIACLGPEGPGRRMGRRPAPFSAFPLLSPRNLFHPSLQSRLTEYLHKQYCSNRAYYAASNLGGEQLPHPGEGAAALGMLGPPPSGPDPHPPPSSCQA